MGSHASDTARRRLAHHVGSIKRCTCEFSRILYFPCIYYFLKTLLDDSFLNPMPFITFCFACEIFTSIKNQTGNLDRSIEDLFEHFVYAPKKSTANPQDIPFFLSTRLEESACINPSDTSGIIDDGGGEAEGHSLCDPIQHLSRYENRAAQLASEFEENMARF